MSGSGHSQVLKMAGEGRAKVDKSIMPPKGFGVIDYVFQRFQEHWRDEWRRRMVSQAGCEALAGEWRDSLRLFSERHIRQAIPIALRNTMPPSCAGFVNIVEQVVEEAKPVMVNRELGKQHLQQIKTLIKSTQLEK